MNDTTLKRIIQILMVIAGTLAAVTAFTGLLPKAVIAYVGIAVAVLTTLAQQLEKHLMPRSGKASADVAKKLSLLLCLGALSLSACGGTYKVAWTTAHAVREAGTTTDKALAEVAKKKHEACLAAHGSKTVGYKDCMAPTIKALDIWTKIFKPAVDAALVATVTGLQIAEQAKDKDYKWYDALKPGACAIIKAVEGFRDLLGDTKVKEVLVYIGAAKTFVCE